MRSISPSHASSFSIQPEKVSLTQMLEALKPHDHLCLIYESPEEWRDAIVPFIALGLKRGEKCCYFADAHAAEQLHGYLQAEGVDVASTEASGRLVILCESEAYTKEGSFDPDLMISLLITETEKAIAQGYPALRLTGEMTWVLHGLPGSERLLEYEAKLNRDFYSKYPALGICQYDRWKFDHEIIKGVIMTHPLLVRGNHIYHNFYYVPPAEFLNRKRAELEVQHWLNNVEREQQIMDILRESEAKYRELAESITDVFFAVDKDLRYTYWNRASEELIGVSAKDALGKHLYDIFPDTEDTRRAVNSYRRALVIQKPQHFISDFSIEGRNFVFEISAYPTTGGLCVYVKDITERKKLEDALKESEQWYRYVFDNAPFGMGFSSIDGKVVTMNKAMEVITGYSAEEFTNINLADTYVNKADREVLLNEIRQHGGVVDYPVQLRRKDGTPYDALLSLRLTTIGDREFVQTICHDVTERKKAEESLRLSERNFRDSIERSPLGIRIVSEDGKMIYANRALLDICGYDSIKEFKAVPRKQIYTPESYAEHKKRMEKRKRGECVPPNYETSIVRKDGKVRYLAVSRREVLWNGEKQFQVVYQDITERKLAEAELRMKDYAMASSISGILLLDLDGVVLYANQAYLDMWAYRNAEQAIGRKLMDMAADNKLARMLLTTVRTKGKWRGELHAPIRDGRTIDVLLSASLVRDEKGVPIAIMASTIDITERKRAELQLQQEKDRAQRYLDIAGVMLIANDAEGRVSLINRKGCEVLGYEQEEIIGKNLFDISIPERMRHEVKAAFNKLMTGELEPFAYYENPVLTKNGEERVIAWHNVLLKDGSGNIVGTLSSGEDVTERKKTEDRVSIQRDLGMALGATYSLDEALKLCLEAALKISGLDCGGIYLADSKSGDLDLACHKGLAVEFVKSASHYEADSVNTRLVMAGEPIYSRHTEFGAPLDTVEQREGLRAIAIMPVFYENHVIGCLNVASHTMDDVPVSSRHALEIVTAQIGSLVGRIKSRQELQTSETRYRLLAENVRDVILAMDMDLRFTYVSPSVKYLGDRTAEDVMSMSFEQLLTPSSQELAKKVFAEELAMADVTEQDPTWSRMLEVEVIHRDGSTFWVELKMSFMRDTAGRPVAILGIMRDISERKKAEEERRALEQKAQLASRLASVGELAAGVAHEINNPLTGVIGYAELLMQEDVPENIKNDLEIIHDGARRVADIVKGLLRFARQTKPERTVVDIDEVIEVCLRLRAYELETSNIKVVSNLAPALPLTIADAGQLQQVFLNLLINAEMEMKLAHGKGKLIIKAEQVNNNIRIYFKDDGPGIAKENLEKIFDPFFTTREVGKGTGLGLSICHGIITEHGGRIWAESQLGKGATFIVELPVVAEKRRATKRQKATRRPKVATKAKILVVDDEPVVRQLVTEVLTGDGHEVETTDDGKDALNRIKSNGYSLILLDMKLPGMSGGELYERIKGMAESLAKRVVFITGDVMAADTEALLARTKVPCITKPFDVHKLKAEISRLLISSRPKQTAKSKKSKTKS